ncbi:MAG: phosphoribosyl-AMP cyclohydrolase [Coriobacteriaceae bacterium]|jgi:phosphoribosyl-AMP cyclohydrolase/phosphoribosyl-ATP pyrophosphohydrolase/phosphoribosyl-AMP cyclohydrolase|nr:phosphoribosyl-AMP cyclohydrolase [Coriobacteriaceae bacterium]
MNRELPELRYNEAGLIPCIVQDSQTREVLMMAWMDAEALQRTRETRTMWFWSRSRSELWNKGATSGNVQNLVELRYDCDCDTLLALVEPAGPACHTGSVSCFYRSLPPTGQP